MAGGTDSASGADFSRAHALLAPLIRDPAAFAVPTPTLREELRSAVKELHDFVKAREATDAVIRGHTGPLQTLLVDGFDAEQVWAEVQLQNEAIGMRLEDRAKQLLHGQQLQRDNDDNDSVSYQSSASSATTSGGDDGGGHEEALEGRRGDSEPDEEEHSDDDSSSSRSGGAATNGHRRNAGDRVANQADPFFSLDDMNAFCDQFEETNDKLIDGNEEALEYAAMYGSGDESEMGGSDTMGGGDNQYEQGKGAADRHAKYGDFFDEPGSTHNATQGDVGTRPEEEEEKEQEEEIVARNAETRKQIESLEKKIATGRSWELMGEISASSRPMDSLLEFERPLEFEHATRPVQPLSEVDNNELELLIRTRIADSLFDDVERRIPQTQVDALAGDVFTPHVEVSAKKSDIGLADIYEREFMQRRADAAEQEQQDAAAAANAKGTAAAAAQKRLSMKQFEDAPLDGKHQEIGRMFAALCHRLDALSSFHFLPDPLAEELSVRAAPNVPAITMEEVIPALMSTADIAAPEDVYFSKARGLPTGDTEKQRSEKQARRRRSKRSYKKKMEARLEKERDLARSGHQKSAQRLAEREIEKAVTTGANMVRSQTQSGWDSLAGGGVGFAQGRMSSRKMFAQLQDTAEAERSAKVVGKKRKSSQRGLLSAAAQKL